MSVYTHLQKWDAPQVLVLLMSQWLSRYTSGMGQANEEMDGC